MTDEQDVPAGATMLGQPDVPEADEVVEIEVEEWNDSALISETTKQFVPFPKLAPDDQTLGIVVDGEIVARFVPAQEGD